MSLERRLDKEGQPGMRTKITSTGNAFAPILSRNPVEALDTIIDNLKFFYLANLNENRKELIAGPLPKSIEEGHRYSCEVRTPSKELYGYVNITYSKEGIAKLRSPDNKRQYMFFISFTVLDETRKKDRERSSRETERYVKYMDDNRGNYRR